MNRIKCHVKQVIFLIIYFSFKLQLAGQTTYSNEISLQGDYRKLYLEFDNKSSTQIRWSIENSGRHQIPLINSLYNETLNTFSGDLSFFGSEVFGSINGAIEGDQVIGTMLWHGDSIPFALVRSERELSYEEENVTFRNGDIQLEGVMILPFERPGPFPAVVFAHGSGPSTRWWGMYWASELSKIGVATLLYDKRGCGNSQGNWTNSSLDDLASDVVAGMNYLKKHPLIDDQKIGVYGVSQGCWVNTRVSDMTTELAFMIANSGGGISPSDEEVYSYDINMKFAGINEKGREEGNKIVKKYLKYLETGQGYSDLIHQLEVNKKKNWYPVLELDRVLVSESNRKNWEWVATYDPSEDIKNLKVPVLLFFGDQDLDQPTDVSIMKWEEALTKGNNSNYTLNVFEGAGHGLVIGGHHSSGFPKYADGHMESLKNWLIENVIE